MNAHNEMGIFNKLKGLIELIYKNISSTKKYAFQGLNLVSVILVTVFGVLVSLSNITVVYSTVSGILFLTSSLIAILSSYGVIMNMKTIDELEAEIWVNHHKGRKCCIENFQSFLCIGQNENF